MSESLISTSIEKQHFYIDKHMVFIYLKLLCWYLLYQHTAPMTMTTTSRMNTPTPTTIPVLIYNNNEGLIKVIIDYFTSLKTLIIFSKENFKHFWSITHKIRKHTYRKKNFVIENLIYLIYHTLKSVIVFSPMAFSRYCVRFSFWRADMTLSLTQSSVWLHSMQLYTNLILVWLKEDQIVEISLQIHFVLRFSIIRLFKEIWIWKFEMI